MSSLNSLATLGWVIVQHAFNGLIKDYETRVALGGTLT